MRKNFANGLHKSLHRISTRLFKSSLYRSTLVQGPTISCLKTFRQIAKQIRESHQLFLMHTKGEIANFDPINDAIFFWDFPKEESEIHTFRKQSTNFKLYKFRCTLCG